MNKTGKHLLLVLALCAFTLSIMPSTASANSAEPPSLVILINNPPDDLSIVLISEDNQAFARVSQVAWEGYYAFYSHDMKTDGKYRIKVTTNGESFECSINEPLQHYNNVYTLDLSNKKLHLGKAPFRSVILVSMRVLLTLLIEGFIFWLFGFRKKRSWLIFFAINLVTQGTLNILLNSGSLMQSYLVVKLIIGEFFVFLAELLAFPVLINEHEKPRILIYVIIANLLSLVAGGYIITLLPV